jgi:hypothetical protein
MDETFITAEAAAQGGIMIGAVTDLTSQIVDITKTPPVLVPAPPPTTAQTAAALVTSLLAYASRKQSQLLTAGQTFNVTPGAATPLNVLCDGLSSTRADLALLALFGASNPTGTQQWITNEGVAITLTGVELTTLATLAGNWVAHTYTALAAVNAAINANPPTITTTAQIDSYPWPTS